jgi:hypothetical protein
MSAPSEAAVARCLFFGEKLGGREAAQGLGGEQGGGGRDDQAAAAGGAGDEVQDGRQLAGELGGGGQAKRGSDERAGQADDRMCDYFRESRIPCRTASRTIQYKIKAGIAK